MVEIIEKEEIRVDLPPVRIDKTDTKGLKTRYREGELLGTIEILSCGHANNLMKKGRTTGVCPKGCT